MKWVTLYKNIYFHIKSVQNFVITRNVVPACRWHWLPNVCSSSYCHDCQKHTATAKYLSPVCTIWSWLYTCLHKCRQNLHVRLPRTKRCVAVIFSTCWLTCGSQSVKLKQVPRTYRDRRTKRQSAVHWQYLSDRYEDHHHQPPEIETARSDTQPPLTSSSRDAFSCTVRQDIPYFVHLWRSYLTTSLVAISAGMQAVQCWWQDTERARPLLGQKHVPSAQVSRGLVWDRTGMFAMRGRRLTDAPSRFIRPVTDAQCCSLLWLLERMLRFYTQFHFISSLQHWNNIFVVAPCVPYATRCIFRVTEEYRDGRLLIH